MPQRVSSEDAPLLSQRLPPIGDNGHVLLTKYQPRRNERLIAYLCFLVLGAIVLLPWNLLIVVLPYFSYRLTGPSNFLTNSAISWIPLVFTAGNLAFLVRATFAQTHQGVSNLEKKISASIPILGGVVLLLLLSTWFELLHGWPYFAFIVFISVVCSAICAITQSSSAALAALFEEPFYIQGVMSGQGAIGFAVAVAQFLAAVRSEHATAPSPGSDLDGIEKDKLVHSTSLFFLISVSFIVVAWLAWLSLLRLPVYQHIVHERKLHDSQQTTHNPAEASLSVIRAIPDKAPSLRHIERKIRHLGIGLFYIFTITIGLFPGVTTAIASTDQESWIGHSLVWIPFGFVLFNTGDWIGRALPGSQYFIFTSKRGLISASAARTLFIPLLLMCNIAPQASQGDSSPPPYFNSDIAYILILLLFAVSNGYLCSLLIMRAVVDPALEADEVDIASSIMLVYLTAGLVSGAILSFIIRSAAV